MGAAAAFNLLLLVCWRLSAQNAAVSGAQKKSTKSSPQSPQELPQTSPSSACSPEIQIKMQASGWLEKFIARLN